MKWLALIPGVILLVGSASSVVRSLIVPRASQSRVLRVVGSNLVVPSLKFVARRSMAWVDQDRLMAFAGPVALLSTFGTWLLGFLVAFALVLWPVDHLALPGAAREAGSTVFTLGTAGSSKALPAAVDYAAASVGLWVVALAIAYVTSLYAALNRPEVGVTLLSGRAGSPPWGPELLARHHFVDMLNPFPTSTRTGKPGPPTWRRATPTTRS